MTQFLPWSKLQNPIYQQADWSVKDACMIHHGNHFYLFFSAFFFADGRERSHVVGVKTTDFLTFSEPLFIHRGEAGGWYGMCSPSIRRIGDTFYLSYNSWGDKPGQPNQLFYATSSDLEHWDFDQPLAPALTAKVRAIDAEIATLPDYTILIWKARQTPQIAYTNNFPDGPWTLLGQPNGGWFENAQFIQIDGDWHLFATGRGQVPQIAAIAAETGTPTDWLHWQDFRLFDIPLEGFNTHERANAGFLADWRQYDGYFYFLYAGTTEGRSHAGRGDNRLGLARSTDLYHWTVPQDQA